MYSEKVNESGNGEEMEQDSDTGFYSQSNSEDEENKSVKRRISDVSSDSNKRCTKKLRKLKKENQLKKLHKPPTANEINRLRETENLFHSNLFRLQIEEMLKEVQVKDKRKLEFNLWYEKFSDWILKAEDNENKYDITDQEWLKKFNIKIPVFQTPYTIKGTYQFKKPLGVSIIGSYRTNLIIGPKFVVDILVEMPESFFQREDYLNSRFHRKRSLYLCELIHHIQLLPNLIEDVVFIAEEIDTLKPKIEITPFGKISKHIKVLLHVGTTAGTFKLHRFSPNKNNVRKKWYFKDSANEQGTYGTSNNALFTKMWKRGLQVNAIEFQNGNSFKIITVIKKLREQYFIIILPNSVVKVNREMPEKNIRTPFYNSTIAADLTLEKNMKFLEESLSSLKNVKDGIILFKIWLRQRELHDSIGGFNGFIVSMLVCYLLKIKKLNFVMSSYQIFRNVCHYLIGCDWTTNGITLCDTSGDENLPTMSEYHENHQVVFIDVTGYHNICYAMSSSLFRNVQHEAQLALKWLNDPDINSFQILFITKVPFYQHYDHIVIFDNRESLENIVDIHCSKEARLNHYGVISPLVRESIIGLLNQGFKKRIMHLHVKLPEKHRWKITKKPRQTITLIVAFNLNPENYFTIVDKALETETETFRQFWGPKSELRRFQDGTITEALVWSGRTLSEKRLICKEILTYLLKLKFGLGTNDFKYVADQLDFFIAKDVEEHSLKVIENFDELSKQLRNLNNLPLNIISVQGISPVFRFTDAFPPVPQKKRNLTFQKRNYALIDTDLNSVPFWISPVDVTIQLEASNKWPQDLEAIRRLRAAFNAKISDSLTSQHGLVCSSFQDQIEVVKGGFIFRIRVVYPTEIVLLKQSVDSDGLIKYKDTEKSLALEKQFIFLPKLSNTLHSIYQEHNSFGPACCMVKRWISSHLIDNYHISEESIELIVASLYLRPQPHEPPTQPQVALFRFFKLMTTTNWNTDCIVLNINNELTRSDIIDIETEFNSNRQNLPAVFIVTPYDRTKSIWTKDSPTPLILLRLMELCANALQIIETQIYSKALSDIEVIFKPCLDIYDVIITLNNSYNSKKKALSQKSNDQLEYFIQKIPINDFDPVSLYLKELREAYSEFALFFYDSYGGSLIAAKWKPNVFELGDFKLATLPAHKYNFTLKKLELNKESILEDFWIIGKNLVNSIDVRENGVLERFESFME